ncbi:glycosyltransferase [Calothrix sp. CCY 0018]|uniref:glycosyltransferase n=1 Tax=Calothrix sp. CCY 0018 TaxID=3103864 RepID=UPI0039C69845
MKVAVVSKSDRSGGGASRVAEDLAAWLNEAGHLADHFVAFHCNEPLSFQQNLYGGGRRIKLCKKIHQKTNELGFYELFPAEYWINLNWVINNYDIVHFHDLYSAISPLTLALTARRKPTFFTVHDCSAFTGYCLYPMGCDKFTTNCHQCPQLPTGKNQKPIPDRTRQVQSIKRWVADKFPIHYIFPSNWMLSEAHKSLKFNTSPLVIPYGIDLKPFPTEKKEDVKISLGIPENRPVVAISAHVLDDPRKGVKFAIAALQSVRDLSPIVISVGICNTELKQALEGLEVKEMGYIKDPQLLAQVYSAADIMLFCTLADNLPLTVLEAMAASTPVVSFATGGVPEMIQSGSNGVLVEPANQQALNQALRQALLSPNLREMGQQARKDVENNFSKTAFLERHLKIYQNLPLSDDIKQSKQLFNV